MSEWIALVKEVGATVAIVSGMLWWLTQKLIPAYQKQNESMLATFREESAAERTMHREELVKMFAMYSELSEAVRSCPVKRGT